jgi:hypothetical protein
VAWVRCDGVARAPNVNIRFQNVTRALHQHLPARLVDFLEIASYVFTADCATERGEQWTDDDSKESWGRDFAFVIPVRDPAFWTKPEVTSLVQEALSFLSNDKYSFTFVPLTQDRSEQHYFEFAERKTWSFQAPERVVMFSGGLDSLAGAVETANTGDHVVLVSHRSVSTVSAHQEKLFHAPQKRFPNQFVHVRSGSTKMKSLDASPLNARAHSCLPLLARLWPNHSVQAGFVSTRMAL